MVVRLAFSAPVGTSLWVLRDLLAAERIEGHRVLVHVTHTGTRDITGRMDDFTPKLVSLASRVQLCGCLPLALTHRPQSVALTD